VLTFIKPDGSFDQECYDRIVKGRKRYLKQLYDGLNDKDNDTRHARAEALGEIGLLESVPVLIDHSDDPDWHVRYDIVNSLESILGFGFWVLLEWIDCKLEHRHKLKKNLRRFWKRNQEFLWKKGKDKIYSAGNARPMAIEEAIALARLVKKRVNGVNEG